MCQGYLRHIGENEEKLLKYASGRQTFNLQPKMLIVQTKPEVWNNKILLEKTLINV